MDLPRRERHLFLGALRAHRPLLTSRTADLALPRERVPVFAESLMVRLLVATKTSAISPTVTPRRLCPHYKAPAPDGADHPSGTTRPSLGPATVRPMKGTSERRTGSEDAKGREEGRRLLAGQIELIETRREEVLALRGRGGGDVGEDLTNDLVGARLVIRAALLAGGLTEIEREGLERSEREATALLREVFGPRGARRVRTQAKEPAL